MESWKLQKLKIDPATVVKAFSKEIKSAAGSGESKKFDYVQNLNKVDETEFGDAFGGSGLALKKMIKDETKGIVKTAFELDNTGGIGFHFEHQGPDLKGSGCVLKEATKKENPKSGGDSASLNLIRDIAIKPSNGISINNAKVYDPELGDAFGDVFGGSSLALKIKDETRGIVSAAFELDKTDNLLGFDIDEGAKDLMLKDVTEGIITAAFERENTGSIGYRVEESFGIAVKPSNGISIRNARAYLLQFGEVIESFLSFTMFPLVEKNQEDKSESKIGWFKPFHQAIISMRFVLPLLFCLIPVVLAADSKMVCT